MDARGDSPRRAALDALLRVEGGAFAHILVPDMLRHHRLDARDRGFVTELVYGTVRMRRALDHLLAQVSSRPVDALDPRVRAALRLGAYQLLVGIAPHAAVGETVNLVSARARGFVNGVLRALSRLGPPWPLPAGDDVTSIAIRTSHPDWIARLLVDDFGAADAVATLELDDEPPPVTLRVNRMRATPEEVMTELRVAGLEVERGRLLPDALLVRHSGDLAALDAIREGRASPQDQASQAVVELLAPRYGERVLDLASAPGGKATAAAERMEGRGLVVAADVHAGRVRTVVRAAERLGLVGTVLVMVADGTCPPVRDGAFDRVLLDAPCSGLGVLRRRPDARWRVAPEDVEELAALQRRLLTAAARAVKRGGRLVYSVCTLTRAETLAIDAWAVTALADFVALAPPAAPWRRHGRGGLLLPSDARTDGMFVLVLERRAAAPPAAGRRAAATASAPAVDQEPQRPPREEPPAEEPPREEPPAEEPPPDEPAPEEPPSRRWAPVR
jgi:16S rRNA (cytosine967-C5)-methyltransferase